MQPASENSPRTELSRQAVHMLVATFALSLRWLDYPQALACAAGLIVFNVFILPRLPGSRRHLYRPEERESGFSRGILTYPISVFILIFAFPTPVAAAMWGLLSLGDGAATLAGARAGGRPLPWNRKKSFAGLLACVLAGAPSAALLYLWALPNVASSPPWWRSPAAQDLFGSPGIGAVVAVSLLASLAGAILESLDTPLDDNLLAPLGAACAMAGLAHILF